MNLFNLIGHIHIGTVLVGRTMEMKQPQSEDIVHKHVSFYVITTK